MTMVNRLILLWKILVSALILSTCPLTERFYRVDSARSRQTGGTGLGLAIVKHVLMQHQAHLEIESKENQGSIFKVIFPKERTYNPE